MARIAPTNVVRWAADSRQHRELETLQRLQSQLPDDYTVFHSVHWTREHQGDTATARSTLLSSTEPAGCLSSSRRMARSKPAERRAKVGDYSMHVDRTTVLGSRGKRCYVDSDDGI